MNDLSDSAADHRRCCDPIPSPIPCLLLPLFLAGLAVSVFILAVVHNAFSLGFLLVLSAFVLSFVVWNLYNFRSNGAVLLFLDRMPASDLLTAKDGQIVKITGRCIADFYVTDVKTGTRALVKAGSGSKISPLVTESLIINTSSGDRKLSSTLKKWLEERHLSSEKRLLRLKEGFIKEGSSLTVMGMLSRKSGILTILPPPEPITTGCLLGKCLLPVDVDGLVLSYHGDDSVLISDFPNQNT